jgi:hypothetical protein
MFNCYGSFNFNLAKIRKIFFIFHIEVKKNCKICYSTVISAKMSVFSGWQIICYLCTLSGKTPSGLTNMLITLTIAVILALVFGKITFKEIKGYVNKLRGKRHQGDTGDGGRDCQSGACGRGEGREEGGEERLSEEGREKGEDSAA